MGRPRAGRRFAALTCTGYLSPGSTGVPGGPGLSAYVYDTAYDQVVATYRSEQHVGPWGVPVRHAWALLAARRHAAQLNREHRAEQAAA